jgi:hypothetical protein
MTLLIAQRDGLNVFIAADSAITGGTLDERQRENALKIIPSLDGRALIGYAGDHYHGARLAHLGSCLPAGTKGPQFLSEAQHDHPSVDFAYSYADDAGCHLFRVADGNVEELQAFHLGSAEAFDHFQRVRHAREIDPVPEAVQTAIIASRASDALPDSLGNVITSLLRVFAERSEHDVGGWVTAYFLTKDGAFLCGYGYSVSDPILTTIGPGSAVPHGTAQAGGFGLSVTELGEREGLVVYWLQLPGGTVFVRTSEGYKEHNFRGTPSQFIANASTELSRKVEIWFGDKPAGQPQTITVLRDRDGVPAMAIANDRGTLSFSVLNVSTPFDTRAELDFSRTDDAGSLAKMLQSDQVRLTFDADGKTTTLSLFVDKQPANKIVLGPRELDTFIAQLGEARARLQEPVPAQPPHLQPGVRVRDLMVLDPAWRTEGPLHPSLNGITLRLRHTGFGWLSFLLPWHEVKNLGEWLKNATPPQSP